MKLHLLILAALSLASVINPRDNHVEDSNNESLDSVDYFDEEAVTHDFSEFEMDNQGSLSNNLRIKATKASPWNTARRWTCIKLCGTFKKGTKMIPIAGQTIAQMMSCKAGCEKKYP